jgi:Leucine-rich repeat (LRR) protein
LSHNQLNFLPKEIIFENMWYIDLSGNRLTSLPDGIKFENDGCVNLSYSQLASLPKGIVFENKVDIDLSHNQLASLPDGIKFRNRGWVDLSHNQLASLPKGIEAKRTYEIFLYSNELVSLPEKNPFKNAHHVCLFNNKLKYIPLSYAKAKELYIFPSIKWNDVEQINKILGDKLSAEEVFAIENIEHRRIAYQYMDKSKMKQLKDYTILDEQIDNKGNQMKIISFVVTVMQKPLKFYSCLCPSSGREYFIETNKDNCWEAKNAGFGLTEVDWVEEW